MVSSNWVPLLKEMAERIASRVSEARTRGVNMDVWEFKHLLDDAAQLALLETLREREVSAVLVSEEGDAIIGNGGPIIVADPIDGTTNLARGLKPAATCLSVSTNGRLSGTVAALVADLYTGETYVAEGGLHAWVDSWPIHVSMAKSVRSALISLDVSKIPRMERMLPLLDHARYIRMLGSTAYELCLVSQGILDAHVDVRGSLRATDVAAALAILEEAGGVYAINGEIDGDLPLTRQTTLELVAASTPQLLEELLNLTKG